MFITGLFGGFGHCIGMCGPLVASYSMAIQTKSIIPHLLYNLGRVTTYSIMGGFMGFTGSFVTLSHTFQQLQKSIMIGAGVVIILMGLSMTGLIPLIKYLETRINAAPFIVKLTKMFSPSLTTGTFYPMGIVLGFIPCGLVYTGLITAARMGMETDNHLEGLIKGVIIMVLFGIGTMPALLLFGKIITILSAKTRKKLYRISALVVIIMGVLFIVHA